MFHHLLEWEVVSTINIRDVQGLSPCYNFRDGEILRVEENGYLVAKYQVMGKLHKHSEEVVCRDIEDESYVVLVIVDTRVIHINPALIQEI